MDSFTDIGLNLMYGPNGIGKSFIALDYALHRGTGFPVLYLDNDNHASMASRVEAWTSHYATEKSMVRFTQRPISLLNQHEYNTLIDDIDKLQPGLIVIDRLDQALFPYYLHDAAHVKRFLEAVQHISSYFRCAVLLVHSSTNHNHEPRGSSLLIPAMDAIFSVSEDGDQISIECIKRKDGEPFPTRYVRLLEITTKYGKSCVVVPSEAVKPVK